MLSSLHIENIAVIRRADIDFSAGFTVLTGETGAGKSLITDGINLLIGNRADREIIRSGEDYAAVSGIFSDIGAQALEILREAGIAPDEDGLLMISRTVWRDGRSQCRIGARTVTASVLREAAAGLVGIHGQQDSQMLLRPQKHLSLLDMYADDETELSEYREKFGVYMAARNALAALQKSESDTAREVDMLKYQIADIDEVKPKAGEAEKLKEEKNRLSDIEHINRQASFAYRALCGGEKANAAYVIERAENALSSVSSAVPSAAALSEKLRNIRYEIIDIADEAKSYTDDSGVDPTERLNRIESRLDKIEKLCRKYGGDGESIEGVNAYRAEAEKKLNALIDIDCEKEKLTAELSAAEAELSAAAEKLGAVRRKAAKLLAGEITESLSYLDMPKVSFEVSFIPCADGEYREYGAESAQFMISMSPAEPPMPLDRVASGGELSRVMLALKAALSDKDGVGCIIYDEIDTGVSGKTARKIGLMLHRAAHGTQIMCVTHSAQIASLADTHLLVRKSEKDGHFFTSVSVLGREGRIDEISRILGGLSVTEAQRRAAVDMLDEHEG